MPSPAKPGRMGSAGLPLGSPVWFLGISCAEFLWNPGDWQHLDSQIKLSWKAERLQALAAPEISVFCDSVTALNHSFCNPHLEKAPFRFLVQSCIVMQPFKRCLKHSTSGQKAWHHPVCYHLVCQAPSPLWAGTHQLWINKVFPSVFKIKDPFNSSAVLLPSAPVLLCWGHRGYRWA